MKKVRGWLVRFWLAQSIPLPPGDKMESDISFLTPPLLSSCRWWGDPLLQWLECSHQSNAKHKKLCLGFLAWVGFCVWGGVCGGVCVSRSDIWCIYFLILFLIFKDSNFLYTPPTRKDWWVLFIHMYRMWKWSWTYLWPLSSHMFSLCYSCNTMHCSCF